MSKNNKMTTCKACNAEIAKNAKVCPYCGAKNKKPFYKRPWFIILVVIVVIGIIASAGGGSDSTDKTTNTAQNTDTNETSSDNSDTSDEEGSSSGEITFDSLEVVNNDECAITITGIDPDDLWGYALDVTLENKSSDKTYMYAVSYGCINGVYCDPYYAEEVAAGKKSNSSISFSLSDLEEQGVGDVTDIELSIRVYDSDDWTADNVAEEIVHIYPYGEENAVTYIREEQASDIVLIDNDDVKVTLIGYEEETDCSEYAVNIYLENKTDTSVMFSVDDASVNGYMEDPFWAKSVPAGKTAFASIAWYWSTLEEDGITSVEEIEMLFKAYDDETYSKDYAEETIILNP